MKGAVMKFQIFAPNKESGMGLVEIVIGLGLLSLVGAMAGTFFKSSQMLQADMRTRQQGIENVNIFMEVLKRDLTRRPVQPDGLMAPLTSGFATYFEYRRHGKAKAGGDTTFVMMFVSYCQNLPPDVVTKFEQKGTPLNLTSAALQQKFQGTPDNAPRCMQAVNCPYGKYSQIVRRWMPWHDAENALAILPNYPFGILPNNSQNLDIGQGVLAASVCAEKGPNNSDRIIVDTAVLQGDYDYRIIRRELVIPRANRAKLEVME